MLDGPSYDHCQTPHHSAPPLAAAQVKQKRIHYTRLRKAAVKNDFRHSLTKKLRETKPCLSFEDNMDQKWASTLQSMRQQLKLSATETKKHHDWFDDNSETIKSMLDNMHKAHKATLKNSSSRSIRQQ